jgi:hypothetical protein
MLRGFWLGIALLAAACGGSDEQPPRDWEAVASQPKETPLWKAAYTASEVCAPYDGADSKTACAEFDGALPNAYGQCSVPDDGLLVDCAVLRSGVVCCRAN